jgi:Tetratricopeptide repeat
MAFPWPSIQQHLSPQHADVAEILQDLARLRELQQQSIEAFLLYQQALPIREQVLGVQHPKTIETRHRLYAVMQALSKTEEAATLEEIPLDQAKREAEQSMPQKQ